MRIVNFLYAVVFCLIAVGTGVAVELTGSTSVNVTSDTAASAKSSAFNSARREVVLRELRSYANPEQLSQAVKDSSNDELMNIISSSSLDGEKISDTTYSAKISFVIDGDAAKRWMDKHSVQNWLPASDVVVVQPVNSVIVNIVLSQPLSDWIVLNSIANGVNIDLSTTRIIGKNVTLAFDEKDFTKLSGALRSNGWRVRQGENGFIVSK